MTAHHRGRYSYHHHPPPPYLDEAACRDKDPELFFPHTKQGRYLHNRAATAPAKAICHNCPVQQQCLEHALATREEGVWGGLDDWEREQLRRKAPR